jgi:hypothetical protein
MEGFWHLVVIFFPLWAAAARTLYVAFCCNLLGKNGLAKTSSALGLGAYWQVDCDLD